MYFHMQHSLGTFLTATFHSDPSIFNHTDGCTSLCYIKQTRTETHTCTHSNLLKAISNIPQSNTQSKDSLKYIVILLFKATHIYLLLVLLALLSFLCAEKGLHSTMCTIFYACFTPCGGRIMTDRTCIRFSCSDIHRKPSQTRSLSLPLSQTHTNSTYAHTSTFCLAVLINA